MKVAFVVGSISRLSGGLLDANRYLAQELEKYGDLVNVLSVRDDFTDVDQILWGSVKTKVFACCGPIRFAYAPQMQRGLSILAPDLVHTQGMWTYPSLASYRWHLRTGRPEVIHPHGMMDVWALKNSGWKKWLMAAYFERKHLMGASCLRALCLAEMESLRAYGLNNPVCVIPNGIDLQPIQKQQVSHLLRPFGKKMLLYLGRLHPKKGLETLVKAWAAFQHSDPANQLWVLVIAGWDEGGHETRLKNLATECGLRWSDTVSGDSTIFFAGPQFGMDKEKLYQACDAFVLPSFSEGLPMVVLEAWAYGKPVILTPQCHLPEGVTFGAALEVNPEEGSLVSGIRSMVAMSADERSDMGSNGRELVRQKFTWDQVADQTRGVQEWLVHGGARPNCVY